MTSTFFNQQNDQCFGMYLRNKNQCLTNYSIEHTVWRRKAFICPRSCDRNKASNLFLAQRAWISTTPLPQPTLIGSPGRFLRPQSFPSGRAWHCQLQSKSRSLQRTPHLLQFLVACVPMQHSMVPIPSDRRASFDQLMSNMNSGRAFYWEDQLQTSDL